MAAKGLYIEKMFCRIAGKPCRVKISNFISKQTQLIIETGIIPEQYGLQIDKTELFKALRQMYPEEFGTECLDKVDSAVIEFEKEQILAHTKSDEWLEGYEAAVEVMQEAMNDCKG